MSGRSHWSVIHYRSEIIFHVIDGGTGVPIKPGVVIPKLEGHPELGALLVVDIEVGLMYN